MPELTRKPPLRTRSRTATFVFSAEASPGGYKCRWLRGKRFQPCTHETLSGMALEALLSPVTEVDVDEIDLPGRTPDPAGD